MAKNSTDDVTLRSKDGEDTVTFESSDKGRINEFRARGWHEPKQSAKKSGSGS